MARRFDAVSLDVGGVLVVPDHGVLGAALDDADISHEGFPFLTCRRIELGNVEVLASRISYVGELGWELYVPMEQGARVWDLLHEAGKPDGAVPVGIGVYGTTGRLEKGYRAYGLELDGDRTIIEAGMARPKVKNADFVGREAYLAQREAAPKAVLCTLTVDDHTSSSGGKRYMLGGEPILTRDGEVLTDAHGHHPYVTTAGSAPSLGKHVLLAYLPPDQATIGNQLAVWQAAHILAGIADLAAVPSHKLGDTSRLVLLYTRAIGAYAKAELVEAYRDTDLTGQGQHDAEAVEPSIVELRRDAIHAIRDMLGRPRLRAELI